MTTSRQAGAIALVGNPNAGKTSLFNQLTCSHQRVGNYSGVTVEAIEAECRLAETAVTVHDLPGIYSLSPYSQDERVARHYLYHHTPQAVINVVDASNLERNLYLTTQLMELGIPMVVAFNMTDLAKARGLEYDLRLLSDLLGVPAVATVGSDGQGVNALLEAAIAAADNSKPARSLRYGRTVEELLAWIEGKVSATPMAQRFSLRWIAIQLLERDHWVRGQLDSDLVDGIDQRIQSLEQSLGEPMEVVLADARYAFISGACREAVRMSPQHRRNLTETADAILLHPVLGFPLFLGIMYLLFDLTFVLSGPPIGWLEAGFGWLGKAFAFHAGYLPVWLQSLISEGILAGVGGVLVFFPTLFFLFLGIALLEESGYMARAAFLTDQLMHKIGLHGKSFIPMLLGFGCSVPAILATRTLESRRDRLTLMLVLPLFSCGARLPIYMLFVPAFFPQAWQAPMIMLFYLVGVLMALGLARLLRKTLLKGESSPFVMELPAYHMPRWDVVLRHAWMNALEYLKKAGTVILGMAVLLWLLTSFPQATQPGNAGAAGLQPAGSAALQPVAAPEPASAEAVRQQQLMHSWAGRIGQAMEPILSPLGFDWRVGTALLGALAAKEVFVAQMGILFAVGAQDSNSLRQHLRQNYRPLQAFCIMLFILISMPCMSTLAVVRQESGSWRWAGFQAVGLTTLAYILTFLVYQIGSRLWTA